MRYRVLYTRLITRCTKRGNVFVVLRAEKIFCFRKSRVGGTWCGHFQRDVLKKVIDEILKINQWSSGCI